MGMCDRMWIGLAAIGLTSTIAQVVLMRELVATFYGNELLFGLVLTSWLAWVAVGSWGLASLVERRFLRRYCRSRGGIKEREVLLATGLMLAATLFPAQVAFVRGARTLLGTLPGTLVGLGPVAAVVTLVLAPLCLLLGFLFTLGAGLTVEQGGRAGQAYVWESCGAVAGGMLFSFALIHWCDPFQIAFLVAAVNLAVGVNFLVAGSRFTFPGSLIAAFVLVVTIVAALPVGGHLHAATLSWQWPDLAFAGDSPYGRLVVQSRGSQRIFYQNGLLAFETQGTFPEEVVHFPLLMHPDPRQVLLIGGGVAGDVREILKHPVTGVTYVELDPLLIETAKAYLPPEEAVVLDDARVSLVFTDGRLYVQETERAFDVVILDLPAPSTGALNRFYTREFFAQVRAMLAADGIFSFGLPSAENYWNPELARRNGSIYHTLREVFPHVVVLPGEHNFFLSSDVPLETDPSALVGRLVERDVDARLVMPDYVEYVLTTDRFAETQSKLRETTGIRLNRDVMPICYYYDLALWISRLYPGLRRSFESVGLISLWWVAVPLMAAVVLVRWRRGGGVPFAVATIGLAEMTLEVVIIFAFQVFHGTLYSRVSLIVTAFMAGLALGGMVGQRLAATGRSARGALVGVQAAVAVYGGLFLLILSLSWSVSAAGFLLLALVAGALAGMAFPLAVALMRGSAGRAAGVIYGADLVGGCLGALVGAVLFVPVLGIPQTCAVVLLVGLAGLLALV